MSEDSDSRLENNDGKSATTLSNSIENSRTSQKLSEYEKDGRNTSSTDPEMMESRIFIGNLASDKVTRPEIEALFEPYGKILGVSLHKSFGFVQYDNKESARQAVLAENGRDFNNLKMDICIATERRKDSSDRSSGRGRGSSGRSGDRDRRGEGERRRRNRSRSLSPRSRYRDRGRGPRDRDDHYRRDRRSPRRRMGPDHFRDFYSPRDLYMLTRDDPFDRFGPDPYSRFFPPPPPMRGGGPPFDYLPPPRRDMLDPWEGPELPPMREPPPRDLHPYDREGLRPPLRDERDLMREPPSKPLAPPKRSIEMEIFLVSNQQKDYGQMIQTRVESLGILVDIIQLNPSVSLVEALNNAARRGLLYTIIITAQHMQHQSVTLTILHGRNPQEHKNMPLADAINLIDRDFTNYCISHRGTLPTPKPSGSFMKSAASNSDQESSLISRAASGENLSTSELNALISSLQKKKQQQGNNSRSFDDQQSFSAEDIQRHQADLQAKIFSLLGPKAVMPSNTTSSDNNSSSTKPSMGPPTRFPDRITGRGRGGASGTRGGTTGNRGGAFGGRGGGFGGRGGRGGAFNTGRGSSTIGKLGPGSNSFGRGTGAKRGASGGRGRGANNFSGDSGFAGNFRSQAYGGFC